MSPPWSGLPSERLPVVFTNLARNLFRAVGSGVAGMTMQALSFSAPFVLGGGAKVLCDVLLFRSFRNLTPAEEMKSAGANNQLRAGLC